MSKQFKKAKKDAGNKLWDAVEAISKLNRKIDNSDDLTGPEFERLVALGRVEGLLEIANDLFPYHEEV